MTEGDDGATSGSTAIVGAPTLPGRGAGRAALVGAGRVAGGLILAGAVGKGGASSRRSRVSSALTVTAGISGFTANAVTVLNKSTPCSSNEMARAASNERRDD